MRVRVMLGMVVSKCKKKALNIVGGSGTKIRVFANCLREIKLREKSKLKTKGKKKKL